MVIRWLGAFGKNASLFESLSFELERTDEVAAEKLQSGVSFIVHARVGLLVKKKAIVKEFNGDCWSVRENGRLVKTRNPRHASSEHLEVWAKPQYLGVVVKGRISKSTFKDLRSFCQRNDFKLFLLKGGELKEIIK